MHMILKRSLYWLPLTLCVGLRSVEAQYTLIEPNGGTITNLPIKTITQSGQSGLVHQSGSIGLATFINYNNNTGYAALRTNSLNSLALSTNSQPEQLTFNMLKWVGIGTFPLSTLDVAGSFRMTPLYVFPAMMLADANGKLMQPGTFSYSIPRSAFRPIVNSPSNSIAESTVGGLYFSEAVNGDFFLAPINLPLGATVTSITLYYIDNSSFDLFVLLRRQGDGAPSGVDFANIKTSGATPGINSITTNFNNIPMDIFLNTTYQIRVGVAPNQNGISNWDGANLQIVAVKLNYTY